MTPLPLLLLLFVLIAIVQQAVAAASPAMGEGEMQQLPPELAERLATTYYEVVNEEATLPVDHIYGEQEGDKEVVNEEHEVEKLENMDTCDDEDSCESSGDACTTQSFFSWILINL